MDTKALILDQLGRHDEAVEWYDKVLAEHPNDPYIIANKARILGLELGKYTEGLTFLNKYLKIEPEHKGLLCNKRDFGPDGNYRKG
jgi:tetratricopeptide (TPR) repeat protein